MCIADPPNGPQQGPCAGEQGDGGRGQLEGCTALHHLHLTLHHHRLLALGLLEQSLRLQYCLRLLQKCLRLLHYCLRLLQDCLRLLNYGLWLL